MDREEKKFQRRMEVARRKSYILARGWHLRWQTQVYSGEPFPGGVPIMEKFLPQRARS